MKTTEGENKNVEVDSLLHWKPMKKPGSRSAVILTQPADESSCSILDALKEVDVVAGEATKKRISVVAITVDVTRIFAAANGSVFQIFRFIAVLLF